MTDMVPEFATPQDALEHFGVKGMKWGVRKAESSATAVKRSKPTNTEIRSARAKQASKQRQFNAQIDKTNLATGKQQEREAKKLADMNVSMLKDPDRATALRLTTGEKFATALFVGTGPIGIGVTAYTVARVSKRKAIERQQRELGVKR